MVVSFGLLVSMSSLMKRSHEMRTGSIFFSTVLGMWRSTCFPNKIVCNYYQSWKYCPTNKFMCSWKLLQIWYVTHKDILILSLLSSDSIEKQLHQDFNNGFGFFVWRCCSTKSGCAIEGKAEQKREDPDNDEGAIAVKALVCVQNQCQLQLGLVWSPNFGG